MGELLSLVFELARAPIEIDDVVTLVAETWQIKDLPAEDVEPEEIESAEAGSSGPASDPISGLDQRLYLDAISRAAWSMLESEDADSHSGDCPHLIRVSTRRDPTSTRASRPPGKPPRAYTLAEAGSSSASATTFEPATVRALLAVLSARS